MVGKLSKTKSLLAKVGVKGTNESSTEHTMKMVTDTGISKTLLNLEEWNKIKNECTLVKTSKRFRPYGTAYHLPILGRAQTTLRAENGAEIKTWVYILKEKNEQCLLGESDGIRLGIVNINLKGASKEIIIVDGASEEVINRITPVVTPS